MSEQILRPRVFRLIKTELATARKLYLSERTPARLLNFRTLNSPGVEGRYRCRQIVAHQIEVLPVVFIGWMASHFSRREGENQPAMARVDRSQAEDVLEKSSNRHRRLCCKLLRAHH